MSLLRWRQKPNNILTPNPHSVDRSGPCIVDGIFPHRDSHQRKFRTLLRLQGPQTPGWGVEEELGPRHRAPALGVDLLRPTPLVSVRITSVLEGVHLYLRHPRLRVVEAVEDVLGRSVSSPRSSTVGSQCGGRRG